MLYAVALGALSLIINAPAPIEIRQVASAAPIASAHRLTSASIFPTTSINADLLDDLAAEEAKKDAIIEAKKAVMRQKAAEAEAKAEAEQAAAEAKLQAKLAAQEARAKAAAEQREKACVCRPRFIPSPRPASCAHAHTPHPLANVRAQLAAEAKAAKATTGTAAASAQPKAKASKYGEVQKINKQAERIEERKAKGEDAPTLFSF